MWTRVAGESAGGIVGRAEASPPLGSMFVRFYPRKIKRKNSASPLIVRSSGESVSRR